MNWCYELLPLRVVEPPSRGAFVPLVPSPIQGFPGEVSPLGETIQFIYRNPQFAGYSLLLFGKTERPPRLPT